MQHLKRAGRKTHHLLCGELTIAEEYLHKCMAGSLSPCLEGTSRTKSFLAPQVRPSSYTQAQSHLCLQQPVAGKNNLSQNL